MPGVDLSNSGALQPNGGDREVDCRRLAEILISRSRLGIIHAIGQLVMHTAMPEQTLQSSIRLL